MGNLLSYKPCFIWEDTNINRGEFIESLNSALDHARKFGDKIYITSDFYPICPSWGDFLNFIYSTKFDTQEMRDKFPWLTQRQHTTLLGLFKFLKKEVPDNISNLQELNASYPNSNNQYIGISEQNNPLGLVSCELTWNEFHCNFVSQYNYSNRCLNFEYFIKFFRSGLGDNSGRIRTLIERRQSHECFTRLDSPPIGSHEKIHIHFENGSALNIDGTWKHGSYNIPFHAREILSEWGFLLPIDHY